MNKPTLAPPTRPIRSAGRRPLRRRLLGAGAAILALGLITTGSMSASAASYLRISGDGSTWAGNAVLQWETDVKAQGVVVDFNPDGSSSGRTSFAKGLSDYTVSEIPYTGDTRDPQDTTVPPFPYSLLPVVAGGTAFMYNVPVNGQRLDTLNLSQAALAGIFTAQITRWDAPEIKATNPGVNLPAQPITVVVRSEGSGATAQFTNWLIKEFPADYAALCKTAGCNPTSPTSYFPTQNVPTFTAQSGSNGVTKYSQSTDYTINYDEYSYPLAVGFPVANIQNAAGFYTVPTADAVAVSLIKAGINTDTSSPNYLSQDLSAVYGYNDPRAYPLSAYSYEIVPKQVTGSFDNSKGATLGFFTTYALCEGQRKMGPLGYSPLPMNLVLAAMDQVATIPGVDADTTAKLAATKAGALDGNANPCNNPTFKPGDDPSHNVLVDTAKFPPGCDAACQAPFKLPGSGVAASGPSYTPVAGAAAGAGAGAGSAGAGGAGAGAAAVVPTAAAVAAAPTTCDAASTGCPTDIAQAGQETAAGGKITPVSTVLQGQNGWTTPQTLMIIGGILLVVLLLGPAIIARIVRDPRGPRR
ncbi:substrate-binding domain-containing protein [Subtercola sp. RTI3]|uniref:substrate-binding domain-containing protein n=1 Tax=Subtercola sp. RTI3 TaxID=3048639 RepID=UPI002B23C14F|nr:substrate-binding domain-containing protein [Subtercola sp. RTI3]MEA9986803.1 substrate-binding domain-containing protein [Subtercola sp. RTI3]